MPKTLFSRPLKSYKSFLKYIIKIACRGTTSNYSFLKDKEAGFHKWFSTFINSCQVLYLSKTKFLSNCMLRSKICKRCWWWMEISWNIIVTHFSTIIRELLNHFRKQWLVIRNIYLHALYESPANFPFLNSSSKNIIICWYNSLDKPRSVKLLKNLSVSDNNYCSSPSEHLKRMHLVFQNFSYLYFETSQMCWASVRFWKTIAWFYHFWSL